MKNPDSRFSEPLLSSALEKKIHPWIYGQFIEHMGRCIYGGIWAEMLEDRKFCFPVTEEYRPYRDLVDTPFPVVGASPWEITGAVEGVAMSREQPLAGEQDVRLRAGSGIRQHDLGVVQGKQYLGTLQVRIPGEEPAVLEICWGEQVVKTLEVENRDFQKREFSFLPRKIRSRESWP